MPGEFLRVCCESGQIELRSFLSQHLGRLCGFCFHQPKKTLAFLFLSFLAASFYGAEHLKLQLAWTYLFEPDDPVVREFERSRELFPYPGDIAVLVDRGTKPQREAFIEILAAEMAREPEHYFHVFYKFDLSKVGTRALFFLEEELLTTLERTLRREQGFSSPKMTSEPAVKLQLKLLEDLKRALLSRGRSPLVPVWKALAPDEEAAMNTSLLKLLNGERYVYATLAEDKVQVLLFKGGSRSTELSLSKGEEVERVRALLKRLERASYGLRVRLTGLPVMLYDERQTCAQDSVRSGLLSICLILTVFALGFGGLRKPLFSVAGLLCGLGWTTAYTAFVVGHLNFITVTMVSMLMGLGIDFGIHFIFRFEEERLQGHSPAEAIQNTVQTTGVDTFVGAAATSASFLALTATDFKGVSDLGLLACGGVLLCFFSTVMVLPALLGLSSEERRPRQFVLDYLARFEQKMLDAHRWVTAGALLSVLASFFLAGRVGFSYDLLAIQSQELTSVQTEKEMLRDYDTTVLSGAVLVQGDEDARALAKRLLELETVSKVGSMTDLLPVGGEAKEALVNSIVTEARKIETPEPISLERARDLLKLQARLQEIEEKSGNVAQDPTIALAMKEVKEVVETMNPGPLQDGLKSFQSSLIDDLGKLISLLKSQETSILTLNDLPEELRIRYVSPEGVYLLSIQPSVNIWKRENLKRFLGEVESLGVTIVGHPVVQSHILESFDQAFKVTPWYTFFGVFTVMFFYLRRLGQVLLSSLPTALGVALIFSVMGVTGIEFNVVNFVALPISVGIGAVYGVHAIHRMEEIDDEAILSTSTGYGILLSGLTTIAGFASLMTAHHRGLSSFGFVISVGVVANLVVSLIVLPALFRFRRQYRASRL